MDTREDDTHTLAKASFNDQHFLLNFIMSNYLGPDVYSDIPRCSAFQRLAAVLPPYTSNNLGTSFLNVSQLESLYYYILRNAHPSLVLKPNMLYMYLKGNLNMLSSEPLEENWQFTSFFPLNLHHHKQYSASHEIVKGIVLIDDPIPSYMKKEDLERFRYLSHMDDLKIDIKKCLSYQHDYQNGRERIEPDCMTNSEVEIAGTISSGNEKSSAMFQEKYKRQRQRGPSPMLAFPGRVCMSKQHNEESTLGRTCVLDGLATLPAVTHPKLETRISDESVILTGTARRGIVGPPVGIVDIGVSNTAYFFQVALPGVQRDFCQFSCEIESDGKVHIQGSTNGGRTIKKRSRVFQMNFRQLCPSGPFTLSFSLPGPVDPRLFSPNFRTDGIFEAVVIKHE